MDAADLDYRARTQSGCIPPHLVSGLLELGHAEVVEFAGTHCCAGPETGSPRRRSSILRSTGRTWTSSTCGRTPRPSPVPASC
ncbi:hypothetical protein FNH04_03370 [Streptomyces phyllanthi]|uniref:Uncharacterized protein n=1 Tax=Streptomyces phyllanthi TaxID=1803180 RepID=A0A5N8VYK1_9ACTN|nr:hypothetical protein [Streptomyces phyllanthi]